jgi:hypothetical protein
MCTSQSTYILFRSSCHGKNLAPKITEITDPEVSGNFLEKNHVGKLVLVKGRDGIGLSPL